ncbi:MAG: hypothetical protein EA355_13220 [Rhodobacteraceae bacterium]|nr:MAG: hypothetical protein EA355_13220 [Paracoccaceae bacterium]
MNSGRAGARTGWTHRGRRMMGRTSIVAAALAAMLCGGLGASALAAEEARLRAAFEAADVNGDGVIDVDEYVAYFVAAFQRHDVTGDGFLRPEDLPNVDMERFRAADRDGDGRISLGEAIADRIIVFFDIASEDGVITLDRLVAHEAAR